MTIPHLHLAAVLLCTAAGSTLALAQGRPWVDPPANLSTPAPPAPAPEKPKAEEAKPAPAAAATPTPAPEAPAAAKAESAATSKPEVAVAKPKVERKLVEKKPERKRAPVVARAKPKAQVAEGPAGARPDGLVVMQMQTLQFPDGRRIQVLRPQAQAEEPAPVYREWWR